MVIGVTVGSGSNADCDASMISGSFRYITPICNVEIEVESSWNKLIVRVRENPSKNVIARRNSPARMEPGEAEYDILTRALCL